MKRNEIERYFKSGEYLRALEGLETANASPWVDTTKLRCMRALGHEGTVRYADRLRKTIEQRAEPYVMNTTERNNLLRYIALVYSERNRPKAACKIIAKLCDENPEVAALHREYAFALANSSRFDEAESELKLAIKLQANNVNSHAQLAHIYCCTGRVDAGWHSYSRAAILEPDNPMYVQRLLYWSNYTERATQQSNYQLTQLWAKRAFPDGQNVQPDRASVDVNPNRRLKIGLVSSDFNHHPISLSITPLLECLDDSEFEVTVYSDTQKVDHITEYLRDITGEWCNSGELSDDELAEQILFDQMDILIDLNGHNRGNRLGVFAKHVAPIQASWLAYPSSTGLKTIAFRITDRIADPINTQDQFYNEKLLRLPGGYICYKPAELAPEIRPIESEGHIRFGSFNSLDKVSILTLDCWSSALLAVPDSTLTIKHQQLASKNACLHILTQLAGRGITSDRIILDASNEKYFDRLDEYNNIDIALDTTPYNGTTSALEALWMGVPIISLSGQTHASRRTASILNRLELDHLATRSIFEFAQRASEIAALTETRNELRLGLRQKMKESSLMNEKQFSREFGNALRLEWRNWCNDYAQN